MGLLSFLKRQSDAPAEAVAPPDAVAVARTRARRRLIGATVLLVVGIVGFPLLFETQPRPIAGDIPIELPRKDGAAAPAQPMASAPAAVVTAPPPGKDAPPVAEAPAEPGAAEITEREGEQGREPVAASAPRARPPAAPRPASAAVVAARPAPSRPAAGDEAARARALLEGRAAASTAATSSASTAAGSASAMRIVVQVGAYTDPDKLREARRKVEALGFKTYTQVVDSEAGKRTRVRIGPFATKAEADRAAARVKGAGLPAAQLSL